MELAERIVKSDHRPGKLSFLSFFFFFQFGGSPQKRGQLPALLESTLVKVAHGPHLHSWKLRGTESRSQEWITRLDAQSTHRFSIKNTGRTKFPEKRF